jgi:hypothetical protein
VSRRGQKSDGGIRRGLSWKPGEGEGARRDTKAREQHAGEAEQGACAAASGERAGERYPGQAALNIITREPYTCEVSREIRMHGRVHGGAGRTCGHGGAWTMGKQRQRSSTLVGGARLTSLAAAR